MKQVFKNILKDSFFNKLLQELPPMAMYILYKSTDEYESLKNELERGEIERKDIKEFIDYIINNLEPKRKSIYNRSLSVLAVALESIEKPFAKEYLEKLSSLNSIELSSSSRIANHCLKNKKE